MAKKMGRTPTTQANHDRRVKKSSHGKFATAAEMKKAGEANKKAGKSQTQRRAKGRSMPVEKPVETTAEPTA